MDKKPSKILWDVPWEELLALELAKSGSQPSHLILHLKHFKKSEAFARVVKCKAEEETEGGVPQAVKICSAVRKMWKAYQSDMKSLTLKVSGCILTPRSITADNFDRVSTCRYLLARDMCISPGMKLMEEIYIVELKRVLCLEKHLYLVPHQMKASLWSIASTFLRFGVVNKNPKADALCVERR